MSQDTWQFLGILVTAVLGLLGIYISTRPTAKKTNTDAAQSMFDQLQEERNEVRSELREARAEMATMRKDMHEAYLRELLRDDFIQELRNHIRLEKGPPPPDWPEGLRDG